MRSRPLRQIAQTATIPAPIKGWNVRDPISSLAPGYARILDNWLPTPTGVTLRGGKTTHVTGLGAAVQSLMKYSAPDGTLTLFGAAGTSIFNVTSAGAVGAAAVAGMTNAKFQDLMISTAGGTFLVICNGADAIRNYNGTSWSTPTITGVSSATINFIALHMKRLWMIEKDSMRVWYLPVNSIAGAATSIDFGAEFSQGGHLAAMASWTRDGGSGVDDVAVFFSSRGELLVYSGTDPASSTTWAKVGTFKIAELIGARCVIKLGADVGVVTAQGLLPLSAVLPVAAAQQPEYAITVNIGPAFVDAYLTNSTTFGWQPIEHAKRGLLIVNVPQFDGATSVQFVQDTRTGGWGRFKDLNALCWSALGDSLYFGTNGGTVYEFGSAATDDGEPITGVMLPAYSDFGTPNTKQFLQARPLFRAAAGSQIPITLRTEYDDEVASVSIASIPSGATPWGSAWGSAWGASVVSIDEWQSIQGTGRVGSLFLGVSSLSPLTYHQTDVIFQIGNIQ